MNAPDSNQPIAVFIPSFGQGGVERMMVHLARGFAEHGHGVDFIVARPDMSFRDRLGDQVRLISLDSSRPAVQLRRLVAYLNEHRPTVLLSAKGRDDRLAIRARDQAKHRVRVFLRTGIHLSSRPKMRSLNPLRRWWNRHALRRLYHRADGWICNSEGVADDLARTLGLARKQLAVIRNPTVFPELEQMAAEPVDHPWFASAGPPIILGASRLTRVKRFDLLLRAAALLPFPVRVVILGEGKLRRELEQLAANLGIADRTALLGFRENPYAYMSKADLFVLSSEREGNPNVLVEALAVGTPAVATDCPSGPREILAGGRYGPLVPMHDEQALAEAIVATLRTPLPPEQLQEAVKAYSLKCSSAAYLRAFGLECR